MVGDKAGISTWIGITLFPSKSSVAADYSIAKATSDCDFRIKRAAARNICTINALVARQVRFLADSGRRSTVSITAVFDPTETLTVRGDGGN